MKQSIRSLKDDISDALFRKMITQNIPLLIVITLISIGTAGFLYYKVAKSHFLVQREVVLVESGKALSGESIENQKYIRLLKQRSVRDSLMNKHNLAQVYGIDLSNENALFQLDKALIDRLQVEEQQKGKIRVRYIGATDSLAQVILNDLTDFALSDLNSFSDQNLTWSTTRSFNKTIKPKFYSILLLILTPVLFSLTIFIAIKQKMYTNLSNE